MMTYMARYGGCSPLHEVTRRQMLSMPSSFLGAGNDTSRPKGNMGLDVNFMTLTPHISGNGVFPR
jgi:hypothetical protein